MGPVRVREEARQREKIRQISGKGILQEDIETEPGAAGRFLEDTKRSFGICENVFQGSRKGLADIQRGFLNCTRPILSILKVLDNLEELEVQSDFIESNFAKKLKDKLKDSVQLLNHEAERTRVLRRKNLAKNAKWPARLVDICDSVDNEDEGELFGKKFREQLHEDAKVARYSDEITKRSNSYQNTGRSNTGSRGNRGYYGGDRNFGRGYPYGGFGRGRGDYAKNFYHNVDKGNIWRPRGDNPSRGGHAKTEN